MNVLDYLRIAQQPKKNAPKTTQEVSIAIVTNFTDDILKKILVGMCLTEGIKPDIFTVPFKQYHFQLKNPASALAKHKPEITFVFFDVNHYISSEFISDPQHLNEILRDLEHFATSTKTLVIQTIAQPASTQHNRLFRDHHITEQITEFNSRIQSLAKKVSNVHLIDTDQIVRKIGEQRARDLRGLYAFSQPWSNDFSLAVAHEWMAYIRSVTGKIRKCIVVDADNTLWGGIVGETGPLGIALGPDYPGNAFQEFQRVLLDYYNHGIILALNSRNNPEDVDEVFAKNKNMILKKSHFAAIVVNWKDKAENLRTIAEELNIGLDSMVFFDDDPVNRDIVHTQLPEVLVPDFSLPPEEYARTLLDLDAFHTLGLTAEDKERGKMYAAERERKTATEKITDPKKYLKTLQIEMDFSCNEQGLLPRLTQLTQKTNQFNLTTYRATEQEMRNWMKKAFVYAGDIKDKFGPYGVTIMAVVEPTTKAAAQLKIFLMSCRVMGRDIEFNFLKKVLADLKKHGIKTLEARFIPAKKNMPSKDFLADAGGKKVSQKKSGETIYLFSTDSGRLAA